MTTLTTSPAKEVLARLFEDVERDRGRRVDRRSQPAQAQATGHDDPPRDPLETFRQAKQAYMAVSRETADLLYILARSRGARSVVEFGTSFGVSTICLAAAVKDNGGGTVIGTEFLPNKVDIVRQTLADAGLDEVTEIRAGDARETLSDGLPQPVDLVFLDGAKELYVDVLHLIEPVMTPGALVIADNAGRAVGFQDYLRGSDRYLSAGFETDVEIAVLTA